MRALISVSDKTGLISLAQGFARLGIEIIATGGTAKVLREAGIKVIDVATVTGFSRVPFGASEDASSFDPRWYSRAS